MGTQSNNRKGVSDDMGAQPRPENVSTVELHGMNNVENRQELMNLAHNHIEKYRNPGDEVRCDDQGDVVIWSVIEKSLALSLAKNIAAAYKGNHPEVVHHNPDHNEFYRISVVLQPLD